MTVTACFFLLAGGFVGSVPPKSFRLVMVKEGLEGKWILGRGEVSDGFWKIEECRDKR